MFSGGRIIVADMMIMMMKTNPVGYHSLLGTPDLLNTRNYL